MSLFLFSKNTISEKSVADGETDIDLYAVPITSLVNITSTKNVVTLYFKDGGSYTTFTGGTTNIRAYEFTQVDLEVKDNTEKDAIITISKLLTEYRNGSVNSIAVDQITGNISIPNVLSILSIKRFNDFTNLAVDPVQNLTPGGDIDQVLTKLSSTDGDVDWLYPHTLFITVRNVSGGTLQKGTPVHATGVTGNVPDVIAADASSSSTMPATYVLNESIANNAQGIAIITGTITGVDTSSFSAGDVVYVAAGGGFTNVKPTGTNLIQNLGVVTRSNSTTGSGVVYGAGRSNDVPNLPSGKFFIGSATNTQESSYTLPTADGTSGQVLTTDGSGAVTFQDPAGGGGNWIIPISARAITFFHDSHYYGSTDGWSSSLFNLQDSTYFTGTGVFPSRSYNGILSPISATEVEIEGIFTSGAVNESYVAELFVASRPADGTNTSIPVTSLVASSSILCTLSNRPFNFSASATGISINPNDLIFITFRRDTSGGVDANITLYVTLTIKFIP